MFCSFPCVFIPSTKSCPADGSISPAINRISVVLPAPSGPIKAVSVPFRTEKSTSCKAVIFLVDRCIGNSFVRCSASIIFVSVIKPHPYFFKVLLLLLQASPCAINFPYLPHKPESHTKEMF